MSNTPDATSTTAIWYACGACAGQGVWHPDRQDVVCVSCGGAIVLPPPPPGPVHTFDLVTHLRDAPENRWRVAFIERRWLGDDVGQVDNARLTTMR